MKYTNIHNLPQPLVNAITTDYKYTENTIGVTSLIKSPQEYRLTKRHYDEMETDVSEGLWRVLGDCIHALLEKNSPEGQAELSMFCEMDGMRVRGRTDLYEKADESVTDWKVTSVYSFLLGDKEDWIWQNNIYGYILRKNGLPVSNLRIYAILRDWKKRDAQKDQNYPQIPFKEKKIELKSDEEVGRYIKERLALHLLTESLPDDKLPECTATEKWQRLPTWALKKKGAKRATRVFEKEEYANTAIVSMPEKDAKNYIIEARQGENVKCTNYCSAFPFCMQAKREGIVSEKEKGEQQ